METYKNVIGLINVFLIKGVFISILVIIAARKVFKEDPGTIQSVNIIRWIIISYAILVIGEYLAEFYIAYFSGVEYLQINLNRATGPYWFAFWPMIAANTVIPLLLLFNKLKNKIYFLLTIAILMNLGWMFEAFVIHVTSMHRDYVKTNEFDSFRYEISILIHGIAVGILTIIAGAFLKQRALAKV